ncbi:MAG: type I-U CRISPR-associated protein Cas5/Cas6 [Acidobacteria bacterium]|nr:type I-U CRISPR-associated protein Cas5/Cas6 [Acidobacteriota bacterium]MYC83869.1 type I-U CRISPR-associated protein Cas5/Cas6 [Acidobacteriota bacterium]
MVAIEVTFLTGRFVAAAHHDRRTAEWPPHPARLFSALVATWADSDQPDLEERRALEWLESQDHPSIHASQATPRSTLTHFVPVNDARIFSQTSYDRRANRIEELSIQIEEGSESLPARQLKSLRTQLRKQRDVDQMVSSVGTTPIRSAIDLMPPGWITASGDVRTGQARVYPSVTPDEPLVTYSWRGNPSEPTIASLDGLCARLTRLGHSSSLVSCRVVPHPRKPNYIPGPGNEVMRSIRSGQLQALEGEYDKHKGSRPRTLPYTSVRYKQAQDETEEIVVHPDTAGDWLVFAFNRHGRRFPSTLAVDVATALRGAVFHYATDPIPEGLAGHRRDGTPSVHPHVAFLPLPWVSHQHSDGRLMGAAIAIPHSLDNRSRQALYRAIGKWENDKGGRLVLTLGSRGRLEMQRVVGPTTLVTLRQTLWSRKSRTWISATPIALPTHPGPLSTGTAHARSRAWARAAKAMVKACHHIGLPEPTRIDLSLAPVVAGSRPAPAFPPFRQPGRGGRPVARRLVHARVTFDRAVKGPVVLGAGRYLGLGLMKPVTAARLTNE